MALVYTVNLPPVTAPDVVSRDLSVNGMLTTVAGTATEVAGLTGQDNDALHIELVDVDDAGNRSQPSVLDTVLLDTIAPPQPGELSIKVTGEI